jgi:phosphoribosylformylglycinamidine synthase
MPIAHNEGRYTADPKTLREIQDQVVFRYCDTSGQLNEAANPNGSIEGIAGLTNRAGNVLGLMPHPERASEPALGSSDGRLLFESIVEAMALR